MYHSHDGLFFGRKANGDVRILKFENRGGVDWPKADGEYPDATLDMTLDKHVWCSAIASVCSRGESGETFDAAKGFHGV